MFSAVLPSQSHAIADICKADFLSGEIVVMLLFAKSEAINAQRISPLPARAKAGLPRVLSIIFSPSEIRVMFDFRTITQLYFFVN